MKAVNRPTMVQLERELAGLRADLAVIGDEMATGVWSPKTARRVVTVTNKVVATCRAVRLLHAREAVHRKTHAARGRLGTKTTSERRASAPGGQSDGRH